MAANRTLTTKFWDDRLVSSLPYQYRYLLVYLKLNKHIQVSGCCKLKVLQMVLETGLDEETVRAGLSRLEAEGFIKYEDDWLAVAGEIQNKGSKLQAAVDQQLAAAPRWVGEYLIQGKEKDERANHPAIVAVRELLERFPPKQEWDKIIEILGEEFDVSYLVQAQAEWARRGYRPYNLNWLYDWYVNRSIPGPINYGNGKRSNTDTLRDYFDEFAS